MKTSEVQRILVENDIRRKSGNKAELERGKKILRGKIEDVLEYMAAVAVLAKWIGL